MIKFKLLASLLVVLLLLRNGVTFGSEEPKQQQSGYSSIYTDRLEDPLAVYFTSDKFDITVDGSKDISDALQLAIDKVQETVRYGVLFIPEGTYRISKTINIWKGIRLIGYGKKRPVFVLGKNTEGYQDGKAKYMFHFCSDKSRGKRPVQDANAGTFYSGMRNIDIKIEPGNPAAVAIRFHVAQHSFLSHMDFNLNTGNIGIEDIGNEIEFCRFFGGDYGIKTGKTSPGWQSLLIDSYFEGQNISAIQTQEAGLMVIRNHFKKVPAVINISEGFPEELWVSDSRFEDVKNAAITISNENNPRTQINLQNIVCIRVPDFVLCRTTGEKVSSADKQYLVKEFTLGLQYDDLGDNPSVKTTHNIIPLKDITPLVASDVPLLPPTGTWINLKSLGAKGDGITDDTKAFEQAIANHDVIYLPSGHYRVTKPIVLREHTILVGLHPSITQIIIRDSTEAYQGAGAPLALLETPKGGTNIVMGIGLNTSGVNPRAVAAKWMAGSKSMMSDVRFIGGHGTYGLKGAEVPVYNDNRTADGNPYRKWDTQYWSLWITNGGGGTFKDIWTPSPYAAAGMYISNTSTEGHIYLLSSEHHVRSEIILDEASNWNFFGLQLEEESGEGPYCLPIDIRSSNNILFANTFLYRVSRVTTPCPYAIRTENSANLTFKGIHNFSWTKFAFENTLFDVSHQYNVRSREIAQLKISGNAPLDKSGSLSKVIIPGTAVEKLVSGFEFIDGATCDSKGNIYFVDSQWHHIYRWDTNNKLTLICDLPMNPVSLACDKKDNLMVVTRFVQAPSAHSRGDISVVSFDPNHPETTMTTLKEVPFDEVKGKATVFYQTTRHRNENNLPLVLTEAIKTCFVSEDGTTVIPNTIDIGQTFSLKAAVPGQPFYAATGPGLRTYRCQTGKDNTLLTPELFAETGATDVAVDSEGNVFIPSDHISVYDRNGKIIDKIEVPERPSTILFGGKDGNVLYICGRSSLYSIQTKYKGK